ncbi:MAG: hypothetical protein JKX80_01850 [Candidatus Pacebacteria bacterium]|nr:hypothetical protein [Candidatus Paceibacterota bacterium]
MNKSCRLCQKSDIISGKDSLLFEDAFCYIVDNGNTHLKKESILMFAEKRLSLIVKKHVTSLTEQETRQAHNTLEQLIRNLYGEEKLEQSVFKCTMGTYSDHFHTHAYFPPFSKKGEIINPTTNTTL